MLFDTDPFPVFFFYRSKLCVLDSDLKDSDHTLILSAVESVKRRNSQYVHQDELPESLNVLCDLMSLVYDERQTTARRYNESDGFLF